MTTDPTPEWADLLARIPHARPAVVAPRVPVAPRRVRTPVWDRPIQATLPLATPKPAPHDGPLTTEELAALSRAGWELTSTTETPAGLVLVTMTDFHNSDRPTEQRTPGGWRMELPS